MNFVVVEPPLPPVLEFDCPAPDTPPLLSVTPAFALPPVLVLFPEDELLLQAMSPREEIRDVETMIKYFNLEFMAA
jgi:hypothetical protein